MPPDLTGDKFADMTSEPQLSVLAPVGGVVVPLADVPDAVFAEEIVGPGLAIEPDDAATMASRRISAAQAVLAPISGRVAKLMPHAFVITSDDIAAGDGSTPDDGSASDQDVAAGGNTVAVLVHLGLNTVQLKGEGFHILVAEGDQVTAGQPIIEWNPAAVKAGGRSPMVPVIALDCQAEQLTPGRPPGTNVEPGERLLVILRPRSGPQNLG
jgi:sugar PTS system EIIA component